MTTSKDTRRDVELFFAIVAPVGIETDKTVKALKDALTGAQYTCHEIRLSKQLRELNTKLQKSAPENERILGHMETGNATRAKLERGDAVAVLSLSEVPKIREKKKKPTEIVAFKNAYIFNSLKHPDEAKTLKAIYGEHFFVISVYEPKEERLKTLIKKIQSSSSTPASQAKKALAEEDAKILIKKDEKEDPSLGKFGQSVRDTFHLADLFVNQNDQDIQIKRFVRLLFGARFITPTIDEYGMQLAQSVALKSADLSRQVGAVIMGDRGEIIAAGCNEVPQPQIGTFWEGDEKNDVDDYRDFINGTDSNVEKKNDLLEELFEQLKNKGWLNKDLEDLKKDELVKRALYEPIHQILKDTRINSIIEFGRIVHAEMSAITDAARRGQALLNTSLYCTTFPCHGCARHIIAAGIKRVFFIEPYPKSLTQDLYEGMVSIDEDSTDDDTLEFKAFIGLAPKQYDNMFKKLPRKDKSGNAISREHIDDYPRIEKPDVSFSYLNLERAMLIQAKALLR